MAKKSKKKKDSPTLDPRVGELQLMYDQGNFADVRKNGALLSTDEALSDKERTQVQNILETVQIDVVAIYAGLGALAFISLIALLSLSAS